MKINSTTSQISISKHNSESQVKIYISYLPFELGSGLLGKSLNVFDLVGTGAIVVRI